MSLALALRNDEGVLLAADSHCKDWYGDDRYVQYTAPKLHWLRGHRAVLVLFPLVPTSILLADKPDHGFVGPDFEEAVANIYSQTDSELQRVTALRMGWPSPAAPLMLVGTCPSEGSPLVRKKAMERLTAEGPSVSTDRELDRGLGMASIGWPPEGNAYLSAVPWNLATNLETAARLVRDVMLSFLFDFEKSDRLREQEATPAGRAYGGPIRMAMIDRQNIKVQDWRIDPKN